MKWYERVGKAGKKFVKDVVEVAHLALDVGGYIPAAGFIPDLANAALYALEGDWKNATFSLVVGAPGIGDALAVGKVAKRVNGAVDGAKVLDKTVDRAKALNKAVKGAKALDNAMDAMKGLELLSMLEKLKPILNVLMGKLDKLFDLLDIPESLRELLMKLLGDTSGLMLEGGKLLNKLSMKDKLKLIKLGNKINNLFEKGVSEAGNINKVKYGEQFGKSGNKKILKPNVEYTDVNGYKYATDGSGRISNVKGKLQLGEGTRNPYAQRTVGGAERLPTDDGGHLIGNQFNGSGQIDNLVQNCINN